MACIFFLIQISYFKTTYFVSGNEKQVSELENKLQKEKVIIFIIIIILITYNSLKKTKKNMCINILEHIVV